MEGIINYDWIRHIPLKKSIINIPITDHHRHHQNTYIVVSTADNAIMTPYIIMTTTYTVPTSAYNYITTAYTVVNTAYDVLTTGYNVVTAAYRVVATAYNDGHQHKAVIVFHNLVPLNRRALIHNDV